ncbi:MAG: NUDIX hydrolase [Actinomycetota bacterium]
MSPGGLPLLGRRFVARGAFITMERSYHLGDGAAWTARDIVRHPGSVAVIPWDGRQVHLTRQYRAPVGGPLLELPAGKRDVPGEDPVETARRECVEEVGLRPGRLTLLHEVYTSPGFTDELTWVFLAEDLEAVPAAPQGIEETVATTVALSLEAAFAALTEGGIRDAKTVVGLYALARHLGR